MLEYIDAHLTEAEKTESWDMRKLLLHITILERAKFYMTVSDMTRLAAIEERLRQRKHELQPRS